MAAKFGPLKAGRKAFCIRRNKMFEKKLLAEAFWTTNEME
jgi:hypothetical protein